MTKPPPQTKEQIQTDILRARWQQVNEFSMQMTANIMAEMPEPYESLHCAAVVLGAIIGNTVRLDETSFNEIFKEVCGIVERQARNTITVRSNMAAIEAAGLGGGDGQVR